MPHSPICILCIAALAAALPRCRAAEIEEAYEPDAGQFDGGLFEEPSGDDAGVGDLCPEDAPDLFNNSYSPYYGGEESPDLVLVEFAHFHCPWCARLKDITHALWDEREDYRQRVRFYYHHFPFSYEEIWQLQALSVAVQLQGMEHFWAFHDWYYDKLNNDEQPSVDESLAYVENQLELEMTQIEAVMESDETTSFLQWDKAQGSSLGVSGTPAVYVCGEKIPNNMNGLWGEGSLEAIIDGYLYGDGG